MAKGCIKVYICQTAGNAASSQLVRSLSRHYLQEQNMVCNEDLSMGKDTHGKPYFLHFPELHFSISHSGDYWLAAFALAPVGIDIQLHTVCRRELLAKRFFHLCEIEWLASNDYQDFFYVWTAKESYVKYTGQGIDDSFNDFSVVENNALAKQIKGAELLHLVFEEKYNICLCGQQLQNVSWQRYDAETDFYMHL